MHEGDVAAWFVAGNVSQDPPTGQFLGHDTRDTVSFVAHQPTFGHVLGGCMKWKYWPESLVALLVVVLEYPRWAPDTGAAGVTHGPGWSPQKKLETRERVRELWYHGYDHYMKHAFPMDELAPLSCTGRGPDWDNPENIVYNDVAGNFSLTLIDVLDTFVVLDDRPGFEYAVRTVIDWVQFDVNTKPQVFEINIRVLGGLLSAHIAASQTGQQFFLPWYRGELLALAYDLGKRLLPAFSTPTGIPYARVNLRSGVAEGESTKTCTAGAGSLILEFGTLSRLTGDDRFEKAARKAFFALWDRRTEIGLVGNTIDITHGLWTQPDVSGIGAGIDSFYEYALKWYILSGEPEFLDVWNNAYASVLRYARSTDGFWYRNVDIYTGEAIYHTVDSLSAFWPGLQVLAGDVENAIKTHLIYWNLWRRHSGLPEVWDTNFRQATSLQYPLRPEFAESTWYLYRATRDPFYLDVGERILRDLIYRAKVECGLAGIKDLRTNEQDDRMESFLLSETLKYLFLLFDEDNPLHSDDSNYIFTTEGHILYLGGEHLNNLSQPPHHDAPRRKNQCSVHSAITTSRDRRIGLVQGMRSHFDLCYSRELVALLPDRSEQSSWSPSGWCERPKTDVHSYEFILSPNGVTVEEDANPNSDKIARTTDGYVLLNLTGIRTVIVQRLSGTGYDIRKLGPYLIERGQTVYVNDSNIVLGKRAPEVVHFGRDPSATLRFFMREVDLVFPQPQPVSDVTLTAYTSNFGGDISIRPSQDQTPLRFRRQDGVRVTWDGDNPHGCTEYRSRHDDNAILVSRGECAFLEKLTQARAAGAAGVVVINYDDQAVNPTAPEEDLKAAGDISDMVMVVLSETDGKRVVDVLHSIGADTGQLMMAVITESPEDTYDARKKEMTGRILYINGHPLFNTKLLV